MDPSNHVLLEIPTLFRVFKDGRVERLKGTETVPAGFDSDANVESKDITISQENSISARLYLPKITNKDHKLPLLIYIHGGAFVIETPFSPLYHSHLNFITAEANVICVSIHYRRAPEHLLPIAYEDTWAAVKWIASHVNNNGQETWLNDHVDFNRVFVAGDSAGANLAHYAAMQIGIQKLEGMKLAGLVALHPYFTNEKPDKLLEFIFPTSKGSEDPKLNPAADPDLGSLGCKKVLIFVAEKDFLYDRAWSYYEALKKGEWDGDVEIVETEGEEHVFHLFKPDCSQAFDLRKRFAEFLK